MNITDEAVRLLDIAEGRGLLLEEIIAAEPRADRRRMALWTVAVGVAAAVALVAAGATVLLRGHGKDPSVASDPPAAETVRLVPSGTCASYGYGGRELACHDYDIAVSGFASATEPLRVTVQSCFEGGPCSDLVKWVPVGPDGSGVLEDGLVHVYDGYVVTVQVGDASTTLTAPGSGPAS